MYIYIYDYVYVIQPDDFETLTRKWIGNLRLSMPCRIHYDKPHI